MNKSILISGWSIRKNSGISSVTISTALMMALKNTDKKILWFTTSNNFCPITHSLAINCDKRIMGIDCVLDHLNPNNKDIYNDAIMDESLVHIKEVPNLSILLESNTIDRDFIKDKGNYSRFKEFILPFFLEKYDIVVADIAGFLMSDVSLYMLKKSDLVINILTQDSVLLDVYKQRAPEFISRIKNRVNVINMVNDVQPDIRTIKKDYEKDLVEISYDNLFKSSCNMGYLYKYLTTEEHRVTKDITKLTDAICEIFNIQPPANSDTQIKKSKFPNFQLGKLFNHIISEGGGAQ